VFQRDLEVLLFPPVDMHTPSLKIEEDIEFQRKLIVKQNLKNSKSETNFERLAMFGALNKYIPTSRISVDLHACRARYEGHFLFWE
jgi:hypothetical protein